MDFYRLVFFDDYNRHMSNYNFSSFYISKNQNIDTLFDSLNRLYSHLYTIYNLEDI